MSRLVRHICLLVILGLCCNVQAAPLQPQAEISLWGNAIPPGSEGVSLNEQITDRSTDPAVPNREISGIGRPVLAAFLPQAPNGVAVVIVPGGNYTKLAYDKEGTEIAHWLNQRGITAFVLKHRLPNEGHQQGRLVPLQDGQRAIRLLRTEAARWKIDPARIGVIGFSAGGHLAASLGLEFARETYPKRDAIDTQSARPDFVALVYGAAGFKAREDAPGMTESNLAYRSVGTLDKVTPESSPTFMVIAGDDNRVAPEANVALWQALRQAKVATELHVVLKGGHGFGIGARSTPSARTWPNLFETWLTALNILQQ